MKLSVQAGATSQSINVFISDSSSTTGAGLTGLVYNTSSLVAYYSFTGANATATAITLATLAAVNSAYSSGGFKEIDATNMPGWYRLDLPNAVLATSKGRVVSLLLKGAANMAPCPIEIELTGWDNQNATPDVNVSKWNSTTVSPFYVRQGTAQAGATATITLDSGASATNNFYNNMTIFLTGGTGAGQTARISDYVGSTKVATIGHNWITPPDNTTTFAILPVRWGGNVDNVIGVIGGAATGVTISGPGVWSYDHTGVALAVASTALSTANWTTSRAGYIDNLNIGGNVASSSEVTSIQNNTRCVRVVPEIVERPDSGTITYRIELLLYDEVGNMEAPDAAPTITLVNQSGTDLSARLDSTTMANVSTGRYRAIYTASDSDTLEQLVWTFSVVEGGATRLYGNTTLIVDTTAVDFTSSDRTKLNQLATDYTTARAGKLDYLTGNVALASGVTVTTNNDKTGYTCSTIGSGAITTSSFAAGAIDAAAIATDALGSLELAAGAATEIATAVASAVSTAQTRCRVEAAMTSSAGSEVRLLAWLERNGERVVLPSGTCSIEVREHGSGSALFTATDSAPNARGVFELTQSSPGFTNDRLYAATVTIVDDSAVTHVTIEAFPVFG